MNIPAQILGLIGIIINIIGIQLKNKKSILIAFLLANLSFALCFVFLKSYSGSLICFVAAIQTLINYLFEKKNKKFPLYLIIIFILVSLTCGFLTYKTLKDLLPVACSLLYTTCIIQYKESNIRVLTLINIILWTIYDFIVGAYTAGINDIMLIVSTVIAIIRYDVIGKLKNMDKIRRLESVHYNGQTNLYMSKKISYDSYDIYFSDLIDDYYWNFATNIQSKDMKQFKKDFNNIKKVFKENNRIPIVYITPTSSLYSKRDDLELTKVYTDSWLILEDFSNYPVYNSELNINIVRVNKDNLEDFITGVSNGFASDDPNEPYQGLGDGYRVALRNSILDNNTKYKVEHYIAKYRNETVGTLTVNRCDDIACIYNVTTKSSYKRKGICREMMSHVIKDLNGKGVKIICLQTEKGFYTEQVYLNLGFKKLFEASAYK